MIKRVTLVIGIIGGIIAIAAGICFFNVILSDARFMVGHLWYMFVLVIATVMGILSLAAIAIRNRRPNLALTILRLAIFGMFLTALMGDVFYVGSFPYSGSNPTNS